MSETRQTQSQNNDSLTDPELLGQAQWHNSQWHKNSDPQELFRILLEEKEKMNKELKEQNEKLVRQNKVRLNIKQGSSKPSGFFGNLQVSKYLCMYSRFSRS